MHWTGVLPLALAWLGLLGIGKEMWLRWGLPADWRWAWLFACASFGVILVVLTEALSNCRWLISTVAWPVWLVLDALTWTTYAWLRRQRGALSWFPEPKLVKAGLRRHCLIYCGNGLSLMLFPAFIFLGLMLVWGGLYAEFNYDSLTYHLPRVQHWLQQQSVAHFFTGNERENDAGPMASYAVMHLEMLCRNDRFAYLVQWFSLLTCAVISSLLAEELWKLRQKSAVEPSAVASGPVALAGGLGFCWVVFIPMGLLQSITAQNDLVVCVWLIGMVTAGLSYCTGHQSWLCLLLAATCAGLGILSKATMFFYAVPFVLAAGVWFLWRGRDHMRQMLAGILVILVLNAPQAFRNWQSYSSPLGSPVVSKLVRNEKISAGGTISNMVRNLYLEVFTGWRPVDRVTEEILGILHLFSGKDMNDPATTYQKTVFYFYKANFPGNYFAGSFCLTLVLAGSIVLALRHPRQNGIILGGMFLVITGYVFFCALLRWQPRCGTVLRTGPC